MPRFVYMALIALSLIWGGSFYFIKTLLPYYGPWEIAFLRSSFGLVTVVLIMLVRREKFGLGSIRWPAMAAMAIINTAIPWALIAYGETHLASGMASILNATTPIWTIVMGFLFFRAASGRNQWYGVGLAFIGVLVVLGITPSAMREVNSVGLLCMVVATCCYGIGTQLSKRLLLGYSMYQVTLGTLLSSSVASLIMALVTERSPFHALSSGAGIPMLIGLGTFGSGVAYILFYYMVQKGSAEFASMVTYLVPCTALIWAYTLLNESIGWNLPAGLCVILAGVYVAGRQKRGESVSDEAALEK